MSDLDFERRLEGLFAEPPASVGASEVFALLVDERLNRGWATRSLLIGGLGALGGLITAWQLMGSGVISRFGGLVVPAYAELAQNADALIPRELGASGLSVETLGMSLVMAAIAVGLGLTRLIREI